MSDYKVFTGIKWVDPCWTPVYIRDNMLDAAGKAANTWVKLDPHTRDLRYHDGTYGGVPSLNPNFPTWKPIKCFCYCNEAAGFYYDSSVQKCVKSEYISPTCEGDCNSNDIIKVASTPILGTKGLIIWNTESVKTSMFTAGNGVVLNITNLEANTLSYALAPNLTLMHYVGYKGIINKVWGGVPTYAGFNRINSIGIWPSGRTTNIQLKSALTCTAEKTFMIGMSSKYGCRLEYYNTTTQISTSIFEIPGTNVDQYTYWHTFPITLPVGTHELRFIGYVGATNPVFAAEVYDISIDKFKELFGKVDIGSLITKDDISGLNSFTVWSTKNFISTPALKYPNYPYTQALISSYDCPTGYTFTSLNGFPTCVKKTQVECADKILSEEPGSNEVSFTILADYIVITYKFLKNAADTWILEDGTDLYNTPMNSGTAIVRNDVQGVDLDTRSRFYAGPNENTPVADSHYYGFSARRQNAPTNLNGAYPNFKRTAPTTINTIGTEPNGTYSLNDEAILRFGGDNQGTQTESILINIKEFKARFGPGGSAVGTNVAKQIQNAIDSFNVECRGWWYNTPTRYPVAVTAKFYTNDTAGGNPITAITQSNYQFIITGGIETTLTTPPVIIATNLNAPQNSGNQYINAAASAQGVGTGQTNVSPEITKRITVLEYNAYTGVGKFVNNNTTLNVAVGNSASGSPTIPSAI